ncbi:glycoside hydrolase family 26 protein [Streptomyces sp. NPDC012637]|uniref:glycoside hydrolase family 26 protein n=1 Tax=Streptomyces sp. NPDC012637 TaxID=3364842 RepID=UPI0036F0996F
MTRTGRVWSVVVLLALFTAAQLVSPGGLADGDAKPAPRPTANGVYTGSLADGIARMAGFEKWWGRGSLTAGRTYLPGDDWESIEGPPEFLRPWGAWRGARAGRVVVLNVPMLDRSEAHLSDAEVAELLGSGASGAYDRHFRVLAQRLVGLGLADSILVLGWEMNGVTFTHRCHPDPDSWRAYWRRIVSTMRAVDGQRFRFDFAPNRGRDAVPWTSCYPGDAYVDVIGMDSYDQPHLSAFREHVDEPYGLHAQVSFAKLHRKPISYPEWGLFRNGDNPAYMSGMLAWFRAHPPLYQSLSDYCPHGVWACAENDRSARVYRGR